MLKTHCAGSAKATLSRAILIPKRLMLIRFRRANDLAQIGNCCATHAAKQARCIGNVSAIRERRSRMHPSKKQEVAIPESSVRAHRRTELRLGTEINFAYRFQSNCIEQLTGH